MFRIQVVPGPGAAPGGSLGMGAQMVRSGLQVQKLDMGFMSRQEPRFIHLVDLGCEVKVMLMSFLNANTGFFFSRVGGTLPTPYWFYAMS